MKEKSCGAVIYKKYNNDIKILLIHQVNGFWSFPKGHVENNETEKDTALREIKEETNLDVDIDINFRYPITYMMEEKHVLKEAVYFVATPKTNDLHIQESEISDFKWLKYEEALSTVTYDNAKEVLKSAIKYIESKK